MRFASRTILFVALIALGFVVAAALSRPASAGMYLNPIGTTRAEALQVVPFTYEGEKLFVFMPKMTDHLTIVSVVQKGNLLTFLDRGEEIISAVVNTNLGVLADPRHPDNVVLAQLREIEIDGKMVQWFMWTPVSNLPSGPSCADGGATAMLTNWLSR